MSEPITPELNFPLANLKGPNGERVLKSAPLGWVGWKPRYHYDEYGEPDFISVLYTCALVREDPITKKIWATSVQEEEVAYRYPKFDPADEEFAGAFAYATGREEE